MTQPAPDSRQTILNHPDAQDCTVYRPDAHDPEAEEEDLGDAKILMTGPFQPPADWDAAEREAFFADSDPELFFTARIECEAKPGSAQHFVTDSGDYVATMPGAGEVVMFFVCDYDEDASGRSYILIRDDEPLL
ncbi:hypothetical protein ACX0MV_17415 [Pseudomonas borbori]